MENNKEKIFSNINENQKLKKKSKLGTITQKSNYLETDFDITEFLNFKKLNKYIKEFDAIFTNSFPLEYKESFHNNLKTLIIKERFINRFSWSGLYQPLGNKITIIKERDKKLFRHKLIHELLHVSSYKKFLRSGLEISDKLKTGYFSVGTCLDEGYTEYLNVKYFSKTSNHDIYEDEKRLAYGIEKIIGKDIMEKAYFQESLLTIINALSEYTSSKHEAKLLIFNMDIFKRTKNPFEKLDLYSELKKEIANLNLIKINRELKSGKINIEEYTRKKFLDIDLYSKYYFMYNEKAVIIEENDHYTISGNFGVIEKNKNDLILPFPPDINCNNGNNNKKLVK